METDVKNVYMVTGFLGSGKTTFLNEWLYVFQDQPFALVINEFGSADVDGSLFDQTRIDVTKISNGSILCSCRSDRFVEAMLNLSKTDVKNVIIETSGISDMAVLGKILNDIQQLTKHAYRFRGLITIADCTRIRKTASVSRPVKGQLVYADYILLNKTDCCTEEEIQEVIEFVKRINPFCPIEKTVHCKVSDPQRIRDLEPVGHLPTSMKDVDSPWLDKFTLWFQGITDSKKLNALVSFIAPLSLRIKGFVETNDGFQYVDAVEDTIKISPYKPHEKSFLVVIYEHDTPLKQVLRKKLSTWFKPGMVEAE